MELEGLSSPDFLVNFVVNSGGGMLINRVAILKPAHHFPSLRGSRLEPQVGGLRSHTAVVVFISFSFSTQINHFFFLWIYLESYFCQSTVSL